MTRWTCVGAVAALIILLSDFTAQADLITNGGFEDSSGFMAGAGNTMDVPAGSSAIAGWTVFGGAGVAWIGSGNPQLVFAPEGSYSLDLSYQGAPYGGVEQSIATTPGDQYQLSFDLGGFDTGHTYSVNVGTGGVGPTTISYTPASAYPYGNDWAPETLDFTATGLTTLIAIVGDASPVLGSYIGLDNVSVAPVGGAATPLPTTLSLLAGGLGLLGLFGRCTKRSRVLWDC